MLELGAVEGQVLSEKYRVLERLGEGGMGVVYAAHHLLLDERVAIKFLSSSNLSPEAMARFEREARAAAKIKSEHVVRVLDVGHLPSGAPFMVMEHLEGEDLGAYLARVGPLELEVAIDFVLQACVAMADAHLAGIVHRDLKPGNLFCVQRSDGRLLIKVLDFGISKQQHGPGDGTADSVTRTGAVLGSPFYMAPEQMRQARDVDARADIWSLGVVLFELLAGQVPFSGVAFGELAIKIATEPAPGVREFRPDLPAALEAAIFRCLEKERALRPADVAELGCLLLPFASEPSRALVERIQRIVQGSASGGPPRAHSLPPSGRTPSRAPQTASAWATTSDGRANRWALVGGATLVSVTLGALGWSLQRARPHERSPPPDVVASADARTRASAAVETTAAPALPNAPNSPSVEVVESNEAPTVTLERPPPAPTSGMARGRRPSRSELPTRRDEVAALPSAAPKKQGSSGPPANCDPPYTLDALGRKRFRPQCFTNSQP